MEKLKAKALLDRVHFLTDSPTSQYRNKNIFCMISKFQTLFNMDATWTYFETSHGKGPCDGIGGVVKREADNAIKHGKALIQNFNDFAAWLNTYQECSKIEFFSISNDDFQHATQFMTLLTESITPIAATMKLHTVSSVGVDGYLLVQNHSCWCLACLKGDLHLCQRDSNEHKWRFETLQTMEAQRGCVAVIKADDKEYLNFYLLKVEKQFVLKKQTKDGNGVKLPRGTHVIAGRYFEKLDDRLEYQKLSQKDVIVPKSCFLMNLPDSCYGTASDVNSVSRILILKTFIQSIVRIINVLGTTDP